MEASYFLKFVCTHLNSRYHQLFSCLVGFLDKEVTKVKSIQIYFHVPSTPGALKRGLTVEESPKNIRSYHDLGHFNKSDMTFDSYHFY